MRNDQIAAVFEELADLLEIQQANPFRVRAYRNATRTISSTADSIAALVEEKSDLTKFSGIGKDLANQIVGVVTTGKHEKLTELRTQVPDGVLDMLRIPGVGPKKVAVFFHKLNLTSLDELKQAAQEG
ncbi:MAG TPA: hypothetical protein DCG12_00785 [Planctomycetaceae bacterium]|nr:hypothetical protein [Planctomycetaceae bacterium]